MIGFKYKTIVILSAFFFFSNFRSDHYGKKNMEITKIIENEKEIDKFILKNFELVSSSYKSPIFPYKVNFKKKTKATAYFCNLPLVDSWVLKQDSRYTFFLILKNDVELVAEISKKYGKQLIESEFEVNNNYIGDTSYYWEVGHINIVMNKFSNIDKITKYYNCSLIAIGNMNYSEIITVPLKGF